MQVKMNFPGETLFTNEYQFNDSSGKPLGTHHEMELYWDESGQGDPHTVGNDDRYCKSPENPHDCHGFLYFDSY